MRRENRTRLRAFWNASGFYMVLLICVAAIGISGYLLFFGGQRESLDRLDVPALWEEDASQADAGIGVVDAADAVKEPVLVELPKGARRESRVVMADDYLAETSGEASIPAEEEDLLTGGEPADPVSQPEGQVFPSESRMFGAAEAVSGSAALPESAEAAPPSEGMAEVVAPFFVWPVNGEVLSGFSLDELVFNATTGDWRVHTGVDIAAPAGTLVGAMGGGVVEDIYEDEMMGWTVVINHGDGLRSVSCGLMSDIPVKVGQTVTAGTVIGGVGGSDAMPAESAISSHLHLECIGGGAQVDPLEILP